MKNTEAFGVWHFRSLTFCVFSLVAVSSLGTPAQASTIFTLTAAQQDYATLSNTLKLDGSSEIDGDVAILSTAPGGPAGNLNNGGDILAESPYTGAAYFAGTVSCGGPPNACTTTHIAGGTHANTTAVTTAQNDWASLVTSLEGLTATLIAGGITNSGLTLDAGVYSAPSLSLNSSAHPLTFDAQGDPNAQFVLIIDSGNNIAISGTATISLINGAQADNVILLYKGGHDVNWNSTGAFNGIFIDASATTSNITFHSATGSTGRIVDSTGAVNFTSGNLNEPVGAVAPEPATLGLCGIACGIALWNRRKVFHL
jgi:hypothetical protein